MLVGIAALVGLRIFAREAVRSGLPANATDAAVAGVIGGLAGAKIIWAIEFHRTAPFLDLLLSRGGLSWFGGFVGGRALGLTLMSRRRLPIIPVLAAAAPALAIGHAIGRIGCFMVGDDYGRPSTLPWAMAFPNGRPPTDVPVHPTQLYEMAALLVLAWWLIRWRRQGISDRVVCGRYLVIAGGIRFAIEFIRVNRPIAGPFTLAQLIAAAVVAAGVALLTKAPERRSL